MGLLQRHDHVVDSKHDELIHEPPTDTEPQRDTQVLGGEVGQSEQKKNMPGEPLGGVDHLLDESHQDEDVHPLH